MNERLLNSKRANFSSKIPIQINNVGGLRGLGKLNFRILGFTTSNESTLYTLNVVHIQRCSYTSLLVFQHTQHAVLSIKSFQSLLVRTCPAHTPFIL